MEREDNYIYNSHLQDELDVLKEIYITELDVEYNDRNQVEWINLKLHPPTAGEQDQKWVCLTLQFKPSPNYPDELPVINIKNPRGLTEEHIISLHKKLVHHAEQRKGEHMLFELIELSKEGLTDVNKPHGECVICQELLIDGNSFTKTQCYHYFHRHCLLSYVEYSEKEIEEEYKTSLQKCPHMVVSPKKVLCPVCREPIAYDLASLKASPVPEDLKPSDLSLGPEIRFIQKQMAELFKQQQAKGGIIDIEEEKNRFLISAITSSAAVNNPVLEHPHQTDVMYEEHKASSSNRKFRRPKQLKKHKKMSYPPDCTNARGAAVGDDHCLPTKQMNTTEFSPNIFDKKTHEIQQEESHEHDGRGRSGSDKHVPEKSSTRSEQHVKTKQIEKGPEEKSVSRTSHTFMFSNPEKLDVYDGQKDEQHQGQVKPRSEGCEKDKSKDDVDKTRVKKYHSSHHGNIRFSRHHISYPRIRGGRKKYVQYDKVVPSQNNDDTKTTQCQEHPLCEPEKHATENHSMSLDWTKSDHHMVQKIEDESVCVGGGIQTSKQGSNFNEKNYCMERPSKQVQFSESEQCDTVTPAKDRRAPKYPKHERDIKPHSRNMGSKGGWNVDANYSRTHHRKYANNDNYDSRRYMDSAHSIERRYSDTDPSVQLTGYGKDKREGSSYHNKNNSSHSHIRHFTSRSHNRHGFGRNNRGRFDDTVTSESNSNEKMPQRTYNKDTKS